MLNLDKFKSLDDIQENHNFSREQACTLIERFSGFTMTPYTLLKTLKQIFGSEFEYKRIGNKIYVSGGQLDAVCNF